VRPPGRRNLLGNEAKRCWSVRCFSPLDQPQHLCRLFQVSEWATSFRPLISLPVIFRPVIFEDRPQSPLIAPRSHEIIDLNDLMEDRWPEICMCAILTMTSLPV
jgi:hypothetical protein